MYRPKSATILKSSPKLTIGRTRRWNNRERVMSANSPGPQTYNVKHQLKKGPSLVFASKPPDKDKFSTLGPGPSDYSVDYTKVLKRERRVTIGTTKRILGNENRV